MGAGWIAQGFDNQSEARARFQPAITRPRLIPSEVAAYSLSYKTIPGWMASTMWVDVARDRSTSLDSPGLAITTRGRSG